MKQWYTVYTKPNRESAAEENLQRQEIRTYLPLTSEKRRRRGKWLDCTVPLFSRYLFVHMDVAVQSTAAIRSTVGVSNLVRFSGEPAAVPEGLIELLRARTDTETGLIDIGKTQFQPGQKVIVVDGPFKDISGIFQHSNGEHRAMILLDLLGRQNSVAIDNDLLMGTV
ncbi:MAG: transcription/translation regulatory transformer protein RfaH [Gammaproteobacteria bacterium]|nr:transcription/translation regulatory transformer protein RfaH [Gammaproteobacteria bacterium]